jgi:hypothetical protein
MPDNATFKMKVAGRAAPTDMVAGEYLVRCLNAEIKRRGGQVRAVLTFRCECARYDGVLLTGWFPVYENLVLFFRGEKWKNYSIPMPLQRSWASKRSPCTSGYPSEKSRSSKLGGPLRFRSSAVESWLKEREHQPAEPSIATVALKAWLTEQWKDQRR